MIVRGFSLPLGVMICFMGAARQQMNKGDKTSQNPPHALYFYASVRSSGCMRTGKMTATRWCGKKERMVSITRKIMMYSNTMVSLNMESLDLDRLLEQYVFKRGKSF